MKKMPSEQVRKNNLRLLGVCLAAFALVFVLLSLPIYQFTTKLYTQKSGNTFVGDERYQSARAEVDAKAAEFQANKGFGDVTVTETVTERVNSKGATTSMVAFQVSANATRTGWNLIASGLPSGQVLLALSVALALAALLMLISLPGTLSRSPAELLGRTRALRRLACALTLIALFLVPVFHFYTVNLFERQIIPQLAQEPTAKLSSLLRSADALLYGGQAGDTVGTLIAGITYRSMISLWLMIPAVFLLLIGLIMLTQTSLAHTLSRGLLYLFVIAVCVMILYPYYVMLITAFRNNAETTDMYFTNIFPTRWVWSNITDIINRGVPRFLLNSLMLSAGATVLALGCGIPAAYAMARMNFRGKKMFLGFVIMSQMFAPIVLLVGISQLMNFLGLNDSILGLMLINAAFNQAFAIWLLRGTFVSISPEMEQAASIDGCNTVSALIRVLLPMAAPGIVTTLIFVFINSWNEYTISTVLISSPFKKPITVGITQFSSFNMIEWQYLFASALVATIPVVIMFMFIEKHLVAGLTSGGVKG
ncbi:MAG TPA: carbohydrate ABC transporter permease [Candidatus Limiplasma sp.]|nr:carbohydrate ABC transporter permease [Candidatus Limiplasma sp.]